MKSPQAGIVGVEDSLFTVVVGGPCRWIGRAIPVNIAWRVDAPILWRRSPCMHRVGHHRDVAPWQVPLSFWQIVTRDDAVDRRAGRTWPPQKLLGVQSGRTGATAAPSLEIFATAAPRSEQRSRSARGAPRHGRAICRVCRRKTFCPPAAVVSRGLRTADAARLPAPTRSDRRYRCIWKSSVSPARMLGRGAPNGLNRSTSRQVNNFSTLVRHGLVRFTSLLP